VANWTHTYRNEQIPGPNAAGVITAHRPGRQIADAITELQDLSVVDCELDLAGPISGSAFVEDNRLRLSLTVNPDDPDGGGGSPEPGPEGPPGPKGPAGPQGPQGPSGAFSGSGTVVIGVRYVTASREFQYQTGTLTATGITAGGWVTFLTLQEFTC
jgi:hypothetical protein